MKSATAFLLAVVASSAVFVNADPVGRGHPELCLVIGEGGVERFDTLFAEWRGEWEEVVSEGNLTATILTPNEDGPEDQKARLISYLEGADVNGPPLWIVLAGHGTFDGASAKFNLDGPDISATELNEVLGRFERTLVVVNCSSSSAPFIPALKGSNRVVVTSTRGGDEYNFSYFGGYLPAAFLDQTADLDRDQQVSLLEATLFAAAKTRKFYEGEGRILTEHALIDDNGDGAGTPAEWFRALRLETKPSEDGVVPDGRFAHQLHLIASGAEEAFSESMLAERNELENQIEFLRDRKDEIDEDDYYRRIERLMVRMARLYDEAGQ